MLGVNFLSFTQFSGIDLASLGAPGCNQYVGADSTAIVIPTAGTATRPIVLPANTGFLGFEIYGQSGVFATGANALGMMFTNGLRLRIGNL